MSIDLELVDTSALIHELMKRYDTGIILLSASQTRSSDAWRSARRGDRMTLVGMMEWQKKGILDEIDERVHLEDEKIIGVGCGNSDCLDCNPRSEDEDEGEDEDEDEDEDDNWSDQMGREGNED